MISQLHQAAFVFVKGTVWLLETLGLTETVSPTNGEGGDEEVIYVSAKQAALIAAFLGVVFVVIQRLLLKRGFFPFLWSLFQKQREKKRVVRDLAELKKELQSVAGSANEKATEVILDALRKPQEIRGYRANTAALVALSAQRGRAARHAIAEGEAGSISGSPIVICETFIHSPSEGEKSSAVWACMKYIGAIAVVETRSTPVNLPIRPSESAIKAVTIALNSSEDSGDKPAPLVTAGYGAMLCVAKGVSALGLFCDSLGEGLASAVSFGLPSFRPTAARVSRIGVRGGQKIGAVAGGSALAAPSIVARNINDIGVSIRYLLSGVISNVDYSIPPLGFSKVEEAKPMSERKICLLKTSSDQDYTVQVAAFERLGAKVTVEDVPFDLKETAIVRASVVLDAGQCAYESGVDDDVFEVVKSEIKRFKGSQESKEAMNTFRRGRATVSRHLEALSKKVLAWFTLKEYDCLIFKDDVLSRPRSSLATPSTATLLRALFSFGGLAAAEIPVRSMGESTVLSVAALPYRDEVLLSVLLALTKSTASNPEKGVPSSASKAEKKTLEKTETKGTITEGVGGSSRSKKNRKK